MRKYYANKTLKEVNYDEEVKLRKAWAVYQ